MEIQAISFSNVLCLIVQLCGESLESNTESDRHFGSSNETILLGLALNLIGYGQDFC